MMVVGMFVFLVRNFATRALKMMVEEYMHVFRRLKSVMRVTKIMGLYNLYKSM